MNETIRLAVYPQPAEAMPALLEALGGSGRPTGILRCETLEGEERPGITLEWDPKRTPASVVMALIDVELRRFNGTRTTKLLAPLSVDTQALVAAEGLHAPDITSERILEVLIGPSRRPAGSSG